MYTHVFVTHAPLQEHLADGIIRDLRLDEGRVLVIRVRGSFVAEEKRPYTVVNGDRFQRSTGLNPFKHRRRNAHILASYRREVTDRLADEYVVYAPMYTYWYLRALAENSDRYFFLEDGFGSLRTVGEMAAALPVSAPGGLRNWLRQRGTLRDQRPAVRTRDALFAGAAGGYVSSPLSFPWLPEERRFVVRNLFTPDYVGQYPGAVILALSRPVESGNISLADYLDLLSYVLGRLRARGLERAYYKLHPLQEAGPHRADYHRVLGGGGTDLTLIALPDHTDVERLAAGNRMTLVTGYSTLALSVHQTGNEVLTYLPEMLRRSAGIRSFLSPSIVRTLGEIANEL